MKRLLTTTAALATTLSVALALAGCGTTEAASGGSAGASASAISLTDGLGKTVTLDAPATKVVGTEWDVVEDLVTLGVDPVGVSDVKGYNAWDSTVKLRTTPKDVGTRGEPSVDSIAALSPDLIVANSDTPAAALDQMRKIAPVLTIKSADGTRQIDQMLGNLDLIAQATGTTGKATEVKDAFAKKLDEGKQKLADAGVAGEKVAFADGYVQANQVSIRPYAKGSLIGDVGERLGLTNAWTVKGDPAYGLASTDVEGLTKLGDVHFLYITNDADGDPFTDTLAKNAVWKSLPFVKSDKVHRLPDGIWMFGGPESMSAYVDAVVDALT